MNYFIQLIDTTNNILWTYILIALLLGCACWFTIRTRFVQFRMLGEMIHLLRLHRQDKRTRKTYFILSGIYFIAGQPCRNR